MLDSLASIFVMLWLQPLSGDFLRVSLQSTAASSFDLRLHHEPAYHAVAVPVAEWEDLYTVALTISPNIEDENGWNEPSGSS